MARIPLTMFIKNNVSLEEIDGCLVKSMKGSKKYNQGAARFSFI